MLMMMMMIMMNDTVSNIKGETVGNGHNDWDNREKSRMTVEEVVKEVLGDWSEEYEG